MPWVQDVQPPKKKRLEFSLENFSGGLNNRSSIIEDNEASNVLNMKFMYHDIMEKRNGFAPIDAVVLPSAITNMSMYRPYTNPDQVIRATDSGVYVDGTQIATVNGRIDTVNFQGRFMFCDGDSLYVYGTFPSTTSTYLDVVGTIPTSDTVLKVVNPPDGFTPLDEVHTQGKTVYDYTAGTVHYEPCVNELNDVYLGANVLPDKPKFIQVQKGRIFLSGDQKDDDNVFISHLQNPYYFAVGLPIQLPPNSDMVRGLYVFDDSLIVGREHDMFYITGDTNNPELGFPLFTLRKINTHTGVANNKSMDSSHNYLFFLGSDGVSYAMSGIRTEGDNIATQIISRNIDVYKAPIGATRDDIMDASSTFDRDNWYLTLGDKTLVYSYRHRAWTLYDTVDMYSPLRIDDRLVWGRKDGKVVEFTDEYLDDGKPMFATWESKAYDMGSATRYKQFREFFLVAHAYDTSDSDIRVTFEIDYSDVRGATVVENKISYWGITKYGSRFIDRNINASIPFVIGRRARYLRVRFSNGFQIATTAPTESELINVPQKYNYMGVLVEDTQTYYYYENGTWTALTDEQLNQPMRVYKVNGEYEMKGKR